MDRRILNIGVDARLLKNPAGVGNYLKNILTYLLKLDAANSYYLFFDEEIERYYNNENVKYIKINKIKFTPWSSVLKKPIKKFKISTYFTPVVSFPKLKRLRVINTIHDFVWRLRKGHPKRTILHNNYWIKKSNSHNNLTTILVSPHLKGLLKKFFPDFDLSSLVVLPHSVPQYPESPQASEEILKLFKIKKEFFLAVGTTFERKNHNNIIKAFITSDKFNEMQLVIAGMITKHGKTLVKTYENEIKEGKIIFTGYLKSEMIKPLYENCKVVLYPSFCEGFGLPILEANYFKKPVITSNLEPFTWVADKSGIFIDPNNVRELKEKMELLISSQNESDALVKNGIENLKRFSWEKNAQVLFDLL